MTLFDQSLAAPSAKNWEPSIRKYVADPAAFQQLDLVKTFKKNGLREVGNTNYSGTVTKVTPGNVDLRVCVDVSRSNVIDKSGRSVVGPGPRRFYRNYSVGRYPNQPGRWLLNREIDITPAQTC
jgi:hypothetical protein